MLSTIVLASSIALSSGAQSTECEIDKLHTVVKDHFARTRVIEMVDENGNRLGEASLSKIRLGDRLMKIEKASFLSSVFEIETTLNTGEKSTNEHMLLFPVDRTTCEINFITEGGNLSRPS